MKKKKKDTSPHPVNESLIAKLLKNEFSQDNITKSQFLFFLLIAYTFSLLCRLIWVYKYSRYEQLYWNGEFIPLTHDSFYFAKQALDAIQKGIPPTEALSIFTVYLAKILPFIPFESLIFYMPAVVGSLIVLPMLLIGRLFNLSRLGFISALLASITVSYYNRTMVGYYDTDMLNITLPLLVLYSIMGSILKRNLTYLFLAVLTTLLFSWWYVASIYLIILIVIISFCYLLVFDRENAYGFITILLILISSLNIPLIYRISGICIISSFFIYFKDRGMKVVIYSYLISIITAILLALSLSNIMMIFEKYMQLINIFFIKKSNTGLQYLDFTSLTGELEKTSFLELAHRISGNVIVFILSVVGLVFLLRKHPIFILIMPLFILGLTAFIWGARYTVYAIPICAFSFGYLILLFSSVIDRKKISYFILLLLLAFPLTFNIKHIIEYENPIVLTKKDIEALTYLKGIAGDNDYVYSWWDYGYAVQYYTGLKTLTDGSRNLRNGYIESLILTTDNQRLAYNLTKESSYLYDITKSESLLEEMINKLLSKKIENPDDIISFMSSQDYKIKNKGEFRVYLFLPYQMISIFDNIIKYSNRSLLTGRKKYDSVFYPFYNIEQDGKKLVLGNKAYIDLSSMEAVIDKENYQIKDFYLINDKNDTTKEITKKTYNPLSNIIILYLKRHHTLIMLDYKTFNSLFVQLFVFQKNDSNYFSVVFSKPYVKIYTLN